MGESAFEKLEVQTASYLKFGPIRAGAPGLAIRASNIHKVREAEHAVQDERLRFGNLRLDVRERHRGHQNRRHSSLHQRLEVPVSRQLL